MKKAGFVLLVIVFAIGCAKWVSVDISDDSIVLISPTENQADSLQKKTFVWEELEGAKQYRLQIVSARFDSILNYVLDSAVSATSYSISLIPNTYEWRVRGENDDYNSAWSTRKLIVSNATSLANQELTGVFPVSGLNTNKMEQTFTWDGLVSADEYSVTIIDEDDQSFFDIVDKETYSYTFTKEGLFTINIKALNEVSSSITSSNLIRIDTTAPAAVTLSYPVDTLDSGSFPHTFSWSINSTNNGSDIIETLLIASDSSMNNILLDTAFRSATSISLDTIHSSVLGKLYWKINRDDAAGNSNTKVSAKEFWIK